MIEPCEQKPRAWKLELRQQEFILSTCKLPPDFTTLDQISQYLPAGAYTTLRTYEGQKVLRLEDHFHRLEYTAQLVGQPQQLDRVGFREALRQVVFSFPVEESLRLRLSLDLEMQPGSVYIVVEALKTPPPEAYQSGVRAVTCDLQRQLPEGKLTRFIARADHIRQRIPLGVHEVIMVYAQGCLLEGLSSNFFAVKSGVLWTAEAGVLAGTTRRLVLESADHLGIAVKYKGVSVSELHSLVEGFITSASRAILPLRQIDNVEIGSICPGEITRQLMADYSERLHSEVEEI